MDIFDILTFEVDKRTAITMTETYQEIGNVSLLGSVLGTYEYGFSIQHTYTSTTQSEYIRFSIDGGTTWTEFVGEPKDTTDDEPLTYNFFKLGVSGDLNLIVEARQETAVGEMIVQYSDAYIRRVK